MTGPLTVDAHFELDFAHPAKQPRGVFLSIPVLPTTGRPNTTRTSRGDVRRHVSRQQRQVQPGTERERERERARARGGGCNGRVLTAEYCFLQVLSGLSNVTTEDPARHEYYLFGTTAVEVCKSYEGMKGATPGSTSGV